MALKTPEETRLMEEEQAAYKDLVEALNAHPLFEKPPAVTLLSPAQLTAMLPNGEFRKINHIGGEEFSFLKCYMGKRRQIIFCLKRESGAEYAHIELTDAEGVKVMEGWRAMTNILADGDFAGAVAKAGQVRKQHETAKAQAEHVNRYAQIGGGSW
ncbi:hypothetical protein [Herbaspirillum huttiense]|uniref:Uncharacterized protein n=1 Tax=Herbaspirillum huttiense subsp. lycopersici TaxID=3074428 RepID=A0ABU2EG45_9BURK|nr:hypothetical protein [Herbaspirillum huttiense]MDR9847111.1 hypothetical protein [Herbaspirillum huttiense SE1]